MEVEVSFDGIFTEGALGLTQGFVISFHVNCPGRWAILQLLSSQASNKMLGELLETNVQNLYVRLSAPSSVVSWLRAEWKPEPAFH